MRPVCTVHPGNRRAFTLIELLVVISIIAILSLLALPNFLDAQTRSKVARVKAELRTMATAIEAYRVDWQKPPPHPLPGINDLQGTPFGYIEDWDGFHGTGTLTYAITTPVPYLTTFTFFDPFANSDRMIPIDERLYTYHAYQWKFRQIHPPSMQSRDPSTTEGGNEGLYGSEFLELYGEYRLMSIGPDRNYYNKLRGSGIPYPVGIPYDPSNGTVSIGNILRSQKYTEQSAYLWDPER